MVGNSGSFGLPGAFGEPDAQDRDGRLGERRDPLLSAFPAAADVRAGAEVNVAATLRPVSSEARSPVWIASSSIAWSRRPVQVVRSGAASSALISGSVEERDERSVGSLGWDREHALDVVGVFGVSERGVAEQRVDRCQPGVAGADAVAALVLEVVEERGDQWRVEVADVELAGLAAGPLGGEREQQPERVAVGGDRVRAGVALPDQPLGEERLQRRRERAHRWPPGSARAAAPASSSSSGAAVRYQ